MQRADRVDDISLDPDASGPLWPTLELTCTFCDMGLKFSVSWPHSDVCSLVVVRTKLRTGKYDLSGTSSCPKLSDFLVFSFLSLQMGQVKG